MFSRSFVSMLAILSIALLSAVFLFGTVLAVAAAPQIVPVQDDEAPPPVPPTPSDVPVVDDGAGVLISLSVAVAGFIEYVKSIFLKPYAAQKKLSPEYYNVIVSVLAVLSGIGAALIAGPSVDFFKMIGIEGLPYILGILASGVVISFGEQFAHYALDAGRAGVGILKKWRDTEYMPPEKQPDFLAQAERVADLVTDRLQRAVG